MAAANEKTRKLYNLRLQMARADLPLKASATHLVFGEGASNAKLLFIGEAPGKNEDLCGRPFCGSAGRHLDELFESIRLSREDVYITSILKYRPPKNRNPKLDEIKAHTPYLIKQIQIISPQVIMPMGNFATRFVLGEFDITQMSKVSGISGLHGKPRTVSLGSISFTVVPLYHPASVMYNYRLKKVMKQDFRRLKKFLPF